MSRDFASRCVGLFGSQVFGSPGGIQTYMRLIVRAVGEAGALSAVVSLVDSQAESRAEEFESAYGFEWYGAGGSRAKFVMDGFRAARGVEHGVFGHISLAPVGWFLEKTGVIDSYSVILHGVEAWKELPPLRRWSLEAADHVICTTPYTADRVRAENDLDELEVDILPLAVEPERFSEVADVNVRNLGESEPLRVVGVGRLSSAERYKGFEENIEAVARLSTTDTPVEYVHVGGGDDLSRLRKQVSSSEADEFVELPGQVSDEELHEKFRWADVFSMPSEGEGFGLVYLEAMHYGLPVIASPEGGAQYVVEDDENGLLVPYGDSERLAEAFVKLRDPEVRERLGRNGRRAVETRFSFERFRKDLLSILGMSECAE